MKEVTSPLSEGKNLVATPRRDFSDLGSSKNSITLLGAQQIQGRYSDQSGKP